MTDDFFRVKLESMPLINRTTKKRLQAIEKLGNKCSRCNYSGPALQIHHKNDDGCIKRAQGETRYQIYREILAGSTEFELLCANCHHIHSYNSQTLNKQKELKPPKPRVKKQPINLETSMKYSNYKHLPPKEQVARALTKFANLIQEGLQKRT